MSLGCVLAICEWGIRVGIESVSGGVDMGINGNRREGDIAKFGDGDDRFELIRRFGDDQSQMGRVPFVPVPIPVILPVIVPPSSTYRHPNACPRCGQVDRVDKLTAIVAAGTQNSRSVGVAPSLGGLGGVQLIGMQGTTKSALASRLSPTPAKPGGIGWRIAGALLIAMLGLFAASILGLIALIPASAGCLPSMIALGCTAICLGLVLGGIPSILRRQAEYDAAVQRATNLASKLYYCYRDDIVWDPQTGAIVPVAQLGSYLYGGGNQTFAGGAGVGRLN